MTIALGVIGGLSLFLYGMTKMADGLQKVAGNKLKQIIQTLTKNRWMGVLVGMIVTMIIQSSSATSVMVVGFVNAGLMTLEQSVGVLFGANIGTTITGQLVSLNLSEIAPIAIALGLFIKAVAKKSTIIDATDILIGFGILFIGMNFLKDSLASLKDSPALLDWILQYGSNPIIGVLIGFGMTILLQSSSATIGVLIAFAANGILPLSSAIYIIYGDNIGTTTTAIISSLGTSRRGKRVAFIHFIVKVIGTIIFMLFLTDFVANFAISLTPADVGRQIANTHTLFNIINVILLFPFANYLVKLAYIVLPLTDEEKEESKAPKSYLDPLVLKTPPIALQNAMYEFLLMASVAKKTVERSIKAITESSPKSIQRAAKYERQVNEYETNIVRYLVQLSQQPNVSQDDFERIDHLFSIVHDVERISDHAMNIAEFAGEFMSKEIQLNASTESELDHIYSLVLEGYQLTIDVLTTGDSKDIERLITIEREIDQLKISIRDKHIKRMNNNQATPESGIFVMDLLSNLERISDHLRSIAENVKEKAIEPIHTAY